MIPILYLERGTIMALKPIKIIHPFIQEKTFQGFQEVLDWIQENRTWVNGKNFGNYSALKKGFLEIYIQF